MRNNGGKHNLAKLAKMRPAVIIILLLIGPFLGLAGCTRNFYRNAADDEVNDILCEKDKYPDWKIEQYHVYPDPRARFADTTDPDHPAMPPDDEATWKLSPHPQAPGKNGVGIVEGTGYLELMKAWDAINRSELAAEAEKKKQEETTTKDNTGKVAEDKKPEKPPEAKTPSRTDNPKQPVQTFFDEAVNAEPPGFLLKMDQSVELGVINSRVYQRIREDLYSVALPVTQQRFNFAYQWADFVDFVRQTAGYKSPVGQENNWTVNSSVSFSKLFSTGALLTFDWVNNTVFDFTGTGFNSQSTINLQFLQPFLQGGGRAVTLEPLTQAERNLVYAIRAYARFRELFYTSVTIGSSPPGTLASAIGSTTGGSPISVLAALGIASTDVSGVFTGYLPTLYRECDLAADKKLVRDLEKALRIYEGYQEGGQFSPLQVDQVRSTLLSAQNTVLSDQQFVANSLDQFKLVLGLPVNIPLILDDTPARPITRQIDRYYEVIADSDAAYRAVEKQEEESPDKLRPFLKKLYANDPLVKGTTFQKSGPKVWATLEKKTDEELKARLSQLRKERTKLLDRKTDLELKKETFSEKEAKKLRDAEIETDLGELEQVLRRYESQPWEKLAQRARGLERSKMFRVVAYSAQIVLVWPRNERFNAVSESWPELPATRLCDLDLLTADVDVAQHAAVEAALINRWDLMNARAQVVDAWRQVRVTANALMGVFNIQYNLNSQTPALGNHPFDFSAAGTQQLLSFNLQFPLNRLAQRNAYRTALLNFQQARRALMNQEDNIASQLRFDVRQLQLFAAAYNIQKKALRSLYSQVESSLELITAPSDPDQLKASSTASQANAAALTNQYLSALGQLNGAQTNMYRIWLSFLATRIQLTQDLERLRMDSRGVWLDEFETHPNAASASGPQDGKPSAGPAKREPTADEFLPNPRPVPPGERGEDPDGTLSPPRRIAPAPASAPG
jgi:hypothetical protein